MPRTGIEEVRHHWEEITDRLFSSRKEYLDYLSFTGKLYKFSFSDSALMFAQKSDVTMVADLATWNKFGRRINRGETGIGVFGENDRCRYLFDVSQTNGHKAPMQWRLDENLSADIIDSVNKSYDTDFKELRHCLSFLTQDAAAGYLPELNEFSQELNMSDEQYYALEKTAVSVANQIVFSRCEYNSNMRFLEIPNLDGLSALPDKRSFCQYNDKINAIAKETLLDFEKVIKNIYVQRREEHERNEIRGRQVRNESTSTSVHDGSGGDRASQETDRSLRSRVDEVDGSGASLQKDSSDNGVQVADNPPPDRHRSSSTDAEPVGSVLQAERSSSDGIQGASPVGNGMGEMVGEHNHEGDSLSHTILNTANEAVSDDAAFVFTEEIMKACFEEVCNHGSNTESGKTRIYHAFKDDGLTLAEKASFLKKEYGIGGSSIDFKIIPAQGFSNHDSKGIDFTVYFPDREDNKTFRFSWTQAAKTIDSLIESGRYLTPIPHTFKINDIILEDDRILKVFSINEETNRVTFFDVLQEQALFREYIYKSIEETQEMFAPDNNAEITQQTKEERSFSIGDKVIVEEREFLIDSINDESVSLLDVESFKRGYPLFRKMYTEQFEALVVLTEDKEGKSEPVIVENEYVPEQLTFEISTENSTDTILDDINPEEIEKELKEREEARQRGERTHIDDMLDFALKAAEDSERTGNNLYVMDDTTITANCYDLASADVHNYKTGSLAYIPMILNDEQIKRFSDAGLLKKNESDGNIIFNVSDSGDWLKFVIPDKFGNKTNSINADKVLSSVELSTMLEAAQTLFKKNIPSPFVTEPENNSQIKTDYHFSPDDVISGGQKTKYKANIEAIQTLKAIEAEQRLATAAEQKILARYSGWGGIPQAFDNLNDNWSSEYAQLKALLSEDEYAAARESTLTSFYTPPQVIEAMHNTLNRFGFEGGNILEPALGVGSFFSLLPEKTRNSSRLYGVELDSVSGRIAKQLHQTADIQITGFENTKHNDNSFDVVLGNVPFGNFKIPDKRYDRYNFQIHDYFFGKAIDKVKPGGVVAFITSKGTLDKKDDKFRRYLAERCNLIGAVRLPNTAFKANAGTEVTSDIIFLQKRETMTIEEPDWISLSYTEDGIPVNKYFSDHPEMMIGRMAYDERMRGKFGDDSRVTTLLPYENRSFTEDLSTALSRLHAKIRPTVALASFNDKKAATAEVIPADPSVRNYTHTLINDTLYFRENESMTKVSAPDKTLERIKGMHKVRNSVLEVINAQVNGCTDEQLKDLQKELNFVYDDFVKKNGYISDIANKSCFAIDDDYNTISALEIVDSEKKTVSKTELFSERTIRPTIEITQVDTSIEALQVSLDIKGCVDIPYMAQLCRQEPFSMISELTDKGMIFQRPEKYSADFMFDGYEEASEYLSGNVREKLKTASHYASINPELFSRNVTALEKVIPKTLEATEISVRIGASWIDIDDYNLFLQEYAKASTNTPYGYPVRRTRTGEYKISGKSQDGSVAATSTYGTKRMSSYAIFENLLNQRDTIVRDKIVNDNGTETYVINRKETQLATEKARQMKEAFPKWLWSNSSRRNRYVEKYNELFNSIKGRDYDGEHQSFPGMNPSIVLRTHQKSAIARAKYNGNTLLAHCVGAGKSFEMIASTMEKKRLGLINKACVVVPKHLTLQTASEWGRLYPTARLMVATPKDFEKNNRQKFIARCVTGNYDAVIMSFTQFERITMSTEYRRQFLKRERDEIINALEDTDYRDRSSIKDLERQKKLLDNKLEKLLSTNNKDTSLQFEQLGFDYLVVDEAHYYKNCLVVSKMKNVSGLSTTAAQKSEDMLMKCQWLNEKTDYKGILFATGTPVSNSMVELYTMKRYLRPDLLKSSGLDTFDDWASTFGEVVSQLEMKPAGNGFQMKKRFSKFVNIPELMQMYKEFSDIQTADMVKLPVPEINGGKPQIVVAQPNDFQKAYMKVLAQRAEMIHTGSVDPKEDNMLKITHEARLLGLDSRCLNASSENSPDSKVNKCVDNIMRIYDKTAADKGVQVVFCDIAINEDDGKYSIYSYIREELERRGIPENEICAAGDAKTDQKRAEMFAQLRSGDKRVIIASTSKLGTGANIQDRLAGLHHLDIPWRPADLEQRNGRILRQGNSFSEVEVLHYTTAETFDTYMLNIITTKQKFISQVMTSKEPARVCEDVDEMVLTYSEMQAITSGNPLVKEKLELDNDIARLKLLESEHQKEMFALQDLVEKKLPFEIQNFSELLQKAKKDLAFSQENVKEEFSINIKGKLFDERKDAGDVLCNEITKCLVSGESRKLGEYMGFSLELEKSAFSGGKCMAIIHGELKYPVEVELNNNVGNIIRIENSVKSSISAKVNNLSDCLKKAEINLSEAQENQFKPFEHSEELKEKLARIAVVNSKLSLDKPQDDVYISDDEDDVSNDVTPLKSNVKPENKVNLQTAEIPATIYPRR